MEEKVTKKPQSHEKTKRLKPVPPPPAQGSKPSRGSPQFAFRIHDDIHEMEAMAKPLVQDIKHLDSLVVPAKDLNMRASYTLALNRSKEKKNSITLDYFKQGNIKPLPVITPAHDSREESMARLEGKLREIEKEVANSKMLDLGIHGKTVKAKLVTDLPPVKDPVPSRIIMSQNAQSKSSAVTHQQTSPALGSQGLKGKKHLPVERRQLGKDEFGGEHPPRNKSCISPNNLSQQHNNISHSEEDNNLPMEASIKNPTNVNGKTKGENYSSKEQLNEPNADKPADIEIETHLENLWNISTGSNFQTSIIGEYQRSRNTRLWGSLQNIKKSSTNEVPRFSLEGTPSPSGFRKLSRVTEVPRLSLEGRPPSPLFFRKSSLVHQSLVGQSPSPLCTRKSSTVSGKLKERKADLNLLGQAKLQNDKTLSPTYSGKSHMSAGGVSKGKHSSRTEYLSHGSRIKSSGKKTDLLKKRTKDVPTIQVEPKTTLLPAIDNTNKGGVFFHETSGSKKAPKKQDSLPGGSHFKLKSPKKGPLP